MGQTFNVTSESRMIKSYYLAGVPPDPAGRGVRGGDEVGGARPRHAPPPALLHLLRRREARRQVTNGSAASGHVTTALTSDWSGSSSGDCAPAATTSRGRTARPPQVTHLYTIHTHNTSRKMLIYQDTFC